MRTYVVTLRLATNLGEHEVEELVAELVAEAQTHLLDGEALTVERVDLA